MSETPKNAASNLLADLSAMLAGPASADGTTRRGSPGMSNDPVIAMKPRAASPLHKIAQHNQQQQHSRNINGSARRNTTDAVTPLPQHATPSPMGSLGGLNQQSQQERRGSYSLDEASPATETMVAYALKALTEEFMNKVDTMTHLFENLEGRMARMESTLEQHTLSVNALNSSVDRNFESLSSNVKDVVRSVQLLKDKQELFEAQQEIARATINNTSSAAAAAKEANTSEEESEIESLVAESSEESEEEEEEEEEVVIEKPPERTKGKASKRGKKEAAAAAAVQHQQTKQKREKGANAALKGSAGVPQQIAVSSGGQAAGQQQFTAPGAPAGFAPAPQPVMFQPRPNQFSPNTMQQIPPQPQYGGTYGGSPYDGKAAAPPPPPSAAAASSQAPPPQYGHRHAGLPAPVLPPPPPYGMPGPPRPPAPPAPLNNSTSNPSPETSSRGVPIEKVVEDVAAMGFTRQAVRDVVRRLTENGQSVDLNIVLDQLMNGPGSNTRGEQRPPPPPQQQQQQWYTPSNFSH